MSTEKLPLCYSKSLWMQLNVKIQILGCLQFLIFLCLCFCWLLGWSLTYQSGLEPTSPRCPWRHLRDLREFAYETIYPSTLLGSWNQFQPNLFPFWWVSKYKNYYIWNTCTCGTPEKLCNTKTFAKLTVFKTGRFISYINISLHMIRVLRHLAVPCSTLQCSAA